MIITWKVKIVDDYKVEALVTFTGFTAEQIDIAVKQYSEMNKNKADIGAFAVWFREEYIETRIQSIEVSYV